MPDDIDVALSVDALSPQLTGIGRYCLELVRGLNGTAGVGHVSCFRGAHWLDDAEELLAEDWQPARKGRIQRRFDDWRRRRRMGETLVHGPNFFLPDWAERGVITVHDLSVLLYPETHPPERLRDFDRRFKNSMDRASAIITDSETVRGEIISMLGVAPERVWAVPLGVHPPTANSDPAALTTLGLEPGQYSLCVSTFEPRKRIDRLVEAYGRLDPALRRSVPLVLAGASGWRNEALNAMILAAQAEGWVKRLDFVPHSVLDTLYARARLFVYPSRYEGFGLPPIEAMRHGIPTVVGDATTLIEVTKGAARVAEADDVSAFSAVLAEALEDTAWRKLAAAQGRAVAESYRWSDCITRTVEVYHAIADS